MHLALAFTCLLAALPASPNPDDLAVTPEQQVKTRALVRQLGSDEYAEREEAQTRLAAMGRLARPALLAGVNTDPSPEVRIRCSELLPRASALDLRARIDTFLADTEGRYEHDLPAWKSFRAVACREWSLLGRIVWSDRELEKSAREVFARLLESPDNRRLLMTVDGSHVELADLVIGRRQELYNQRRARGEEAGRDPTLEDVTALLFAESRVGSQYTLRRASASILMSSSGFYTAARGADAKSRVYRALAAAWLDSRNEAREMYQAMSIATNLDLNDQSCTLAARLLTMPGVTPSYRGRAASNLAAYGGPQHIPMLEKAMGNALVVYSVRKDALGDGGLPDEAAYEIQLRDLALAVAVLLAGEKLENFGFTDRYAGAAAFDGRSYTYTRHYFADDAARAKAFEKWTARRKAETGR